MLKYIVRRLILMIPTLIGITLITFAVVNLAPGSPIEQKLQQLRFAGSAEGGESSASAGQGTSVVSNEVLEALKKQYGFDKPIHIRYWIWLKNIARLDFGESFTYEEPVIDVIASKFPVSLSFGIVAFILSYLISIPLGVFKAISHGSSFDKVTSFLLFVAYSIPGFMLGIFLITFFSGQLDWFPMGGLYSDFYDEMNWYERIFDRIYHFILPTICYTIGSYTLLEKIFELDGMGLLSFNSMLSRDYNVILGIVFITSFIMLIGQLISDIFYVIVDPRIDFE